MGVEIERKFLVASNVWRDAAGPGIPYRQGYLSTGGPSGKASVRVRVAGDVAWLTIKGPTAGLSRSEYEYEIPVGEANEMLAALCEGAVVEKVRFAVTFAGRRWEVDEFAAENAGLIVAEVELEAPDAAVDLPPWVGEEVSDDPRYFNAALARHPYRRWGRV